MILNSRSLEKLEGVHPDLVRVVKLAAHYTEHDFMDELKISIISGGDWKSFRDYPHIELNRKNYP
ncbi:MAG: hypothetical protein EBR82_35980 [Caulobacteraceae bacterium]|nr:hypothetical protein [Caulobacteraceae bacterium]